MTPTQLLAALQLGEDQDVEFKSANRGLPKSLWETLSAFANTNGGRIVFGVAESGGSFALEGVRNPQVLLKAFWDNHNNPQKLSHPVCREQDVTLLRVGAVQVICLYVPRMPSRQRPIFINGNPLLGTYKRNYDGDYRCTEAEVRRMLREASDEPLDGQILENFDARDLDAESLSAFRNRFASRDATHPFLALDERAFLESLGRSQRPAQPYSAKAVSAYWIGRTGWLRFSKDHARLARTALAGTLDIGSHCNGNYTCWEVLCKRALQ